jgi:hypothetical protein
VFRQACGVTLPVVISVLAITSCFCSRVAVRSWMWSIFLAQESLSSFLCHLFIVMSSFIIMSSFLKMLSYQLHVDDDCTCHLMICCRTSCSLPTCYVALRVQRDRQKHWLQQKKARPPVEQKRRVPPKRWDQQETTLGGCQARNSESELVLGLPPLRVGKNTSLKWGITYYDIVVVGCGELNLLVSWTNGHRSSC